MYESWVNIYDFSFNMTQIYVLIEAKNSDAQYLVPDSTLMLNQI